MQYRFIGIFLFLLHFGIVEQVCGVENTEKQKPAFSEEILKYRIQLLNERTPIQLEFNAEVKRYIDLFSNERKDQFEKIIGLSKLYFPTFEEELDKSDLPYELKYLSIVESALDPMAVSKSGAVGLWQFKIGTGKMFDLQIDSYIDERRDPLKSTHAACEYMTYLYRIFGDWRLAISAYNGGPGAVRQAIEKANGKTDYWEIFEFLPEPTKKYLPAFVAVNYMMNHYKDYNISEQQCEFSYYQTDTVHVNNALTFYDLQKVLDISIMQLRFLNPSYKRNFVPNSKEAFVLVLPKSLVQPFRDNLELIYSDKEGREDGKKFSIEESNKDLIKIYHRVEYGDFLHKIAILYKCTIEDILAWNRLDLSNLKEGQELILYVQPEVKSNIIDGKKSAFTSTNGKDHFFYYTVQKGDTLDKIVRKFNGADHKRILRLNNLETNAHVKTKKKLLINVSK